MVRHGDGIRPAILHSDRLVRARPQGNLPATAVRLTGRLLRRQPVAVVAASHHPLRGVHSARRSVHQAGAGEASPRRAAGAHEVADEED